MWAFPPLALAAVGMWRRRRRKEEADPLSSRKKQARKQLKGVLAAAAKGEVGLDELGAAVHAFLQASLDIPRSEANRTRYESALNHLGGAELTQTWLAIVDTVDRGRFAPGAPQPADLASQVEAAMRALDSTQRGRPTGKATALLALCLTGMSLAAWGAPDPEAALTAFQSGNVAYTEGDYEGAIEAYTSVLDKWTSFELEYNLGGAHHKAGNIGPCILHYERARRLRPNDDDLNANLLLAQSAVTDRIEGMPEIGTMPPCGGNSSRRNGWPAGPPPRCFSG